jgi:hypothetical protein
MRERLGLHDGESGRDGSKVRGIAGNDSLEPARERCDEDVGERPLCNALLPPSDLEIIPQFMRPSGVTVCPRDATFNRKGLQETFGGREVASKGRPQFDKRDGANQQPVRQVLLQAGGGRRLELDVSSNDVQQYRGINDPSHQSRSPSLRSRRASAVEFQGQFFTNSRRALAARARYSSKLGRSSISLTSETSNRTLLPFGNFPSNAAMVPRLFSSPTDIVAVTSSMAQL